MRGAFIVQLGPDANPAEGRFEGWVKEVDLCCELRFRSSEELLKFLAERFEVAKAAAAKTRAGEKVAPAPSKRKQPCKDEHSD